MILFVFGSGISPAPKVKELTKAVLSPHSELDTYARATVLSLLGRMRDLIAEWNKKDRDDISYEEIGAVCVALDAEFGTGRNAALAPCWRMLAREYGRGYAQSRSVSDDDAFSRLLQEAVRWIKHTVALELGKPMLCDKDETIKKFFAGILPSVTKWAIVTLNHDLRIETALSSLDQRPQDGFESSGDLRIFHPDHIRNSSNRLLLKLHGSIDWRWSPPRDNYIKPSGSCDSYELASEPEILIGTYNKLENYSYAIYPYLFAAFDRLLSQANTVVVCGYGFGDKGVNLRIFSELRYRPELTMLILHPEPKHLTQDAPFHAHKQLRRLSCTGRVRFMRCKFEEALEGPNRAKLTAAIRSRLMG